MCKKLSTLRKSHFKEKRGAKERKRKGRREKVIKVFGL